MSPTREEDDKRYKDRPDFSNVQADSSSTAPSYRPQTKPNGKTYVVVKGDSLSKIAKSMYGHEGDWRKIYEANRDKIKDPDLIHPGQELRIP